LPSTEPRARWLATVWKQLAAANGRAMHAYLGAALPPSDREYLLSLALTNLEAGLGPGPARRADGSRGAKKAAKKTAKKVSKAAGRTAPAKVARRARSKGS
jgi:hypothetical protein